MEEYSELDTLSFEDALNDLESVVAKLESGKLSLDESISLYHRGQQLSHYCNLLLDRAESQIESDTSVLNDK